MKTNGPHVSMATGTRPSSSRGKSGSWSLRGAARRRPSSPYVHVVDAVCAALPPLRSDQREKLALFADGPPDEQVGIEPYVPEEVMPR